MITAYELGWVVGFLDGEGSFIATGSSLKVQSSQREEWPMRELQRLLGGNVSAYHETSRIASGIMWRWAATGIRAAGIAMTVYAKMSPKRQAQIRRCLDNWRAHLPQTKYRIRCPKGHPLTGENVYRYPDGRRECRVCIKARFRSYYHIHKCDPRRKNSFRTFANLEWT